MRHYCDRSNNKCIVWMICNEWFFFDLYLKKNLFLMIELKFFVVLESSMVLVTFNDVLFSSLISNEDISILFYYLFSRIAHI